MLTQEIESVLKHFEKNLNGWKKVDQFTFKHDGSNCFFTLNPTIMKFDGELIVLFKCDEFAFSADVKKSLHEFIKCYQHVCNYKKRYNLYLFEIQPEVNLNLRKLVRECVSDEKCVYVNNCRKIKFAVELPIFEEIRERLEKELSYL